MVLSKRLYTPRSFDLGIEMDIYVCKLDVSALLAAIYVIQPAWARKYVAIIVNVYFGLKFISQLCPIYSLELHYGKRLDP